MSKKLILLHTTPRLKTTTLTPFFPSSYSLVSFSRPRLSRPYPLQIQCKALSFPCPTTRLPFVSLVVAGRRAVGFSARAFDDSGSTEKEEMTLAEDNDEEKKGREEYPSGEFEFREFGAWRKLGVKVKMLVAFPWERVKKGSVLTMKLRGQISDQLKSRFSSGLSLPQICENLTKAAYDSRISGVYLHIDSLNCGWGKVEEIRRHILNFKKSGKFIIGYVPTCREKEYYLASSCEELYAPPSAYFSLYGMTVQASFLRGTLEKLGIEPQVERIGKYKSAGDQLARRTMSEENCEMLTAILDTIYGTWIDEVSTTTGKQREEIENFVNEGVFELERLKEEGWITNICYDDEVLAMLKEKVGVQKDKNLPMVDYGKYSRVRNWTVGLSGGKDLVAVIRASGSISRVKSPLSVSGSGIVAEQLIEKIRMVRESKKFKAAILRIDSPGGDALASDLMWRELRLLAESKPVVASMADVAASGGYYMAMGTGAIVAESLTLTGSIGVVTGKFNLGNLYEKIGFNKEIISRGRFAELLAAEQRPFRPDEAGLFSKMAQNAYKMFRDKAAFSRGMRVEKMEEVAQGRVWIGKDAASRGLVDAIGGFSRAVAIAKHKAKIPQDSPVTLVELSRPSPTLPEILSGIGSSLVGVDTALKELLQELRFSEGVQARMDGILFQRLEDSSSFTNPILALPKELGKDEYHGIGGTPNKPEPSRKGKVEAWKDAVTTDSTPVLFSIWSALLDLELWQMLANAKLNANIDAKEKNLSVKGVEQNGLVKPPLLLPMKMTSKMTG